MKIFSCSCPKRSSPPDALLHLHRVPRQVVVDRDVAELEVESLRAHLAEQQELKLAGPEVLHDQLPLDASCVRPVRTRTLKSSCRREREVLQRPSEEREDHCLAHPVVPRQDQSIPQRLELRVDLDRHIEAHQRLELRSVKLIEFYVRLVLVVADMRPRRPRSPIWPRTSCIAGMQDAACRRGICMAKPVAPVRALARAMYSFRTAS